MDNRSAIRDFMISRRARISPEQAGLTSHGIRRVPGLRRSEVAALAGVSLDDAERAYLADLARNCGPATGPAPRRPQRATVRPNLRRLLDALTGVPALVLNGRSDLMAANPLGRALFAPLYEGGERPNHARFVFLDPRAARFWIEWERVAGDSVALLQMQAARRPYDQGLIELIGELNTRSDRFRAWWARHDVRAHTTGIKRLRHPVVGDLDLTFEVLTPAADDDQALIVYGAEPGTTTTTTTEERLRQLAGPSPEGSLPFLAGLDISLTATAVLVMLTAAVSLAVRPGNRPT